MSYKFGDEAIPPEFILMARKHVFAMVVSKPVGEGHIIVCPSRRVYGMKNLTELETLEIFTCAQELI